ncbi:MAG: MBL fold metallo-hydrolase [Patescibacteria group bacterium]
MEQWFKVRQISSGIHLIDDQGQSNIFLLVGTDKALLVDTGWGIGDLPALVAGLTDRPVIVVNTHGHPDHVGGGHQFPEIKIKAEDIPLFQGCFSTEDRTWALERVLGRLPFPDSFDPKKWIGGTPGRVVPIEDGHVFDLGNREIEVMAIPGHTPGGIALLDRRERTLLAGDSVLRSDIWMHLDESTSLKIFQDSLRVIVARSNEFDTILPSHGRDPLEVGIVAELIDGIGDILAGKRKGIPYKTFAGDGLLCRFATCGVVYRDVS